MSYFLETKNVGVYVDQIQQLGDKNRARLGFLCAPVFEQMAHDGKIYCAVENKKVLGYVMFRYNQRTNRIILVHVCVDQQYRNTGIAKEMIELVIGNFPFARSIEASCRRDYKLDKFWKKNGFHVAGERPGRSLSGSVLTIWQRQIQTVNLLTLSQQAEAGDKITVVLDTSVVIELCDIPDSSASCLHDEYISDYVTYMLTPECWDELNQKSEDKIRKKHLEYAGLYQRTVISESFEQILSELQQRVDPHHAHEADIRHLAHCITNNVDVFVTNDQWLCNQRETLKKEYLLDILHPEELYATIDERVDAASYLSRSLTGSRYAESPLKTEDIGIASELAVRANQKKKDFAHWLRETLSSVTEDVYIIRQDEVIVGLYALHISDHFFELSQLLLSDKTVGPAIRRVLTETIVENCVRKISTNTSAVTALLIPFDIGMNNTDILSRYHFWKTQRGYIKFVLGGSCEKDKALQLVSSYLHARESNLVTEEEKESILEEYRHISNVSPVEFEELLAPIILTDLDIPNWIIPIHPEYAVRLFDNELANMNPSFLPNEHEYAALSSVNSYYTRTRKNFVTPCRIFWYVTKSDAYIESGAIRAVSTMLSTDVGTKKQLFSQHKKYGVLEWREMDQVAAEDKLRVFTFGNTRLLPRSVSLGELRKIAAEHTKKELQLQGPNRISSDMSRKILNVSTEA